MSNISVVINTKNASTTLERTLKSVKFAQEIVICDMQSSDATVTIAQKFTDKIFSVQDVGFADPMRNFALSKATHDWILVVDADEEIPATLQNYLIKLTESTHPVDAYYIARQNIIFDKWVQKTGWWPDYQIRFFKKGAVQWSDKVHTLPEIKGSSVYLPAQAELAIIHHNYQTVEQYLERLNRYTTLENSHLNETENMNPSLLIGNFRQELMRRLFADQGIDEGMHGVGLSYLQAMYQLIVVMKQWEKKGFPETRLSAQSSFAEFRLLEKDLNYWMANYHVTHTNGLTQAYWRIRRRFKI
jgi:glycosyltransferase involved in cell wall biosynthesis